MASATWLVAALALSRMGIVTAPITATQTDYRGWQGAWQVTNGDVEVVLVPQISRIMRYGPVGGANILWENPALLGKTVDIEPPPREWVNLGGDKLWLAPQDRCWPPDPYVDPGRMEVTPLPDGLRCVGLASVTRSIRFIREIHLAPRGSTVTMVSTLVNEGDTTIEWAIWQVTQVADPDFVELPRRPGQSFPTGFRSLSERAESRLRQVRGLLTAPRDSQTSYKFGAAAPEGWLAAQRGDVRFVMEARLEPTKTYPDGGCAQEVYSNPNPLRYMEMEMLSPVLTLRSGQSGTLTVRWRLERSRW